MNKVKNNDIDHLAVKLGVDNFNYKTIKQREDQLERIQHWPLYKEILELTRQRHSGGGEKTIDHLKIMR